MYTTEVGVEFTIIIIPQLAEVVPFIQNSMNPLMAH